MLAAVVMFSLMAYFYLDWNIVTAAIPTLIIFTGITIMKFCGYCFENNEESMHNAENVCLICETCTNQADFDGPYCSECAASEKAAIKHAISGEKAVDILVDLLFQLKNLSDIPERIEILERKLERTE